MLTHQEQNDNEYTHTLSTPEKEIDEENEEEIEEETDIQSLSTNSLLEDYLDQVCAPLVGKVPRSKREEIRDRVRQRLEQFAAAHRELGSTAEDAIELAMAQCGEPELISSRWLPEQQSDQRTVTIANKKHFRRYDHVAGTAKAATAVALVTFGLPFIVYLTQVSTHLQSASPETAFVFNRVWLLAVPLIAGILTGLAAKNRPVRGAVNAVGLLAGSSIAVSGIASTMMFTGIGPDITQFAGGFALAAFCGIVPWVLLGSAGAAVGQRIRKTGNRFSTRIGRVLRTRKPA